jgi:hypothetical protein
MTSRSKAMKSRTEYLVKMRAALDQMQVKASLAKLELKDLRRELLAEHDTLLQKMEGLKDVATDRWDAVKGGFEAAWHAFKKKYDDAMSTRGGG